MKKIIVSAPGKIHLLGEHTVVYGKPALLAAIDKRCRVELIARKDQKQEIIISESTDKKLIAYVFFAINTTVSYYHETVPSGFTLTISSEIPFGAGLGSSAASAVAIAGAVTLFLGKPFDKKIINDIAFLIEKRQHGNPSGGDNSASCFGEFIWYRKETEEVKVIQSVSISLSKKITGHFFLIDTGKPKESTKEMVGLVKQFVETNQKKAQIIFDEQEQLVRELVPALQRGDEQEIIRIIRSGERNLEKIGVVSESVKKLIRTIEQSGGVAKILGGGGKQSGVGMILVFMKKYDLQTILKKDTMTYELIGLGEEGVRRE